MSDIDVATQRLASLQLSPLHLEGTENSWTSVPQSIVWARILRDMHCASGLANRKYYVACAHISDILVEWMVSSETAT